jgi:hypothetical protein
MDQLLAGVACVAHILCDQVGLAGVRGANDRSPADVALKHGDAGEGSRSLGHSLWALPIGRRLDWRVHVWIWAGEWMPGLTDQVDGQTSCRYPRQLALAMTPLMRPRACVKQDSPRRSSSIYRVRASSIYHVIATRPAESTHRTCVWGLGLRVSPPPPRVFRRSSPSGGMTARHDHTRFCRARIS